MSGGSLTGQIQGTDTPCSPALWPDSLLYYDVTLPTLAENLALDEALLAEVDRDPIAACLRIWQPADYGVVLGRSNNPDTEAGVDVCAALGIPILRRASGGGTVLVGPGCLCYSLVLPVADLHRSLGISNVTAELMSRTAKGLNSILADVEICGTSDLARRGLKFSGNAQRWLRKAFIHHGTLLYDFDLALLERCLRHPTREPTYRQLRHHGEFVTNLPVQSAALKSCLKATWNGTPAACPAAIFDSASQIASSRYCTSDWTISPRREAV